MSLDGNDATQQDSQELKVECTAQLPLPLIREECRSPVPVTNRCLLCRDWLQRDVLHSTTLKQHSNTSLWTVGVVQDDHIDPNLPTFYVHSQCWLNACAASPNTSTGGSKLSMALEPTGELQSSGFPVCIGNRLAPVKERVWVHQLAIGGNKF